ncbi:MAG: hypothetical protein Q8P48_09855 [Deltaproteobacteria bacterium]|nr:hypothetical protein [Deltaproteobacteria bacterium]
MISSIGSSLSGIRAAFRLIDASAHNTANVNTDGFKGHTVRLSEAKGGGVAAIAGTSTAPGPLYMDSYGNINEASNTSLADEAGSIIIARHMLRANLAALKTAEEMEKSVIDTLG